MYNTAKDWITLPWVWTTFETHMWNVPLFPLIKQSPYLFFSCPLTYSSVCSIAMFIYPSKHAKIPEGGSDVEQHIRQAERCRKLVHLCNLHQNLISLSRVSLWYLSRNQKAFLCRLNFRFDHLPLFFCTLINLYKLCIHERMFGWPIFYFRLLKFERYAR